MDTSCDLNTNNIIYAFMHYMARFQLFVEGESREKKEPSIVWTIFKNCFMKIWTITMETLCIKKIVHMYQITKQIQMHD
jgi:hypothetical protein